MDDKQPRGGSQTASVSSSGFMETPPQVTTIVSTKLARSQLASRFGPLQVSPCPPRAAAEDTVKMHGEQWGRKVTNPFCQLRCRETWGASPNPSQGFWKPLRAALAPQGRLLPSSWCLLGGGVICAVHIYAALPVRQALACVLRMRISLSP